MHNDIYDASDIYFDVTDLSNVTFIRKILEKTGSGGAYIRSIKDIDIFGDDLLDYFDKACRESIAFDYLVDSLANCKMRGSGYDALVLYDGVDDTPVAFIMSQYGECKMKPSTVSLRLVCSSLTNTHGIRSGGALLLGLFIYQAILHGMSELILEVAGGKSRNWIAACLYERFGFEVDKSLKHCFYETQDDAPMILKIDNTTDEMIRKVMTSDYISENMTKSCRLWNEAKKNEDIRESMMNTSNNGLIVSKLEDIYDVNYYDKYGPEAEYEYAQQMEYYALLNAHNDIQNEIKKYNNA